MPPTGKWRPLGDSMILSGSGDAEIARALGVSTTTVLYHRRRLGIPPAGRPGTRPQRGETSRSHSIRLTDEEIRSFEGAAGEQGWREWLRGVGRKSTGLD